MACGPTESLSFGDDAELVARAGTFHPWDSMSPRALCAIVRRGRAGPFSSTAETGCGGSTIVFSHLSAHHTAFALEGNDRTITELSARSDLKRQNVVFVEGLTKDTLPGYNFGSALDMVLLDGPHAYPLPQLEYVYLFPHIRVGGWLVLDDVQIPAVHELFRFLRKEASVVLEEVVFRTAFFRRVRDDGAQAGPDGWWLQGMNRRVIWRYGWRELLRGLVRGRRRRSL